MKPIFFCVNRNTNRAEIVQGFDHWEMVQNAARFGILMADGNTATGIGRCNSRQEFESKAKHSNFEILKGQP